MTWEGRVRLRASSAPPDSTPVWVDITAYVHPGRRGTGWALAAGRQSTLSVAEPARLTLTLDNADHRFTPDNPSSPYFPWWTQGCRLQLQEQIGSWASDYPDFFLELPEVIVRTPGVDQTVTLTAIDRLGRLQSARTFISTLGAHIVGSGGTALRTYWPLGDDGPAFTSATAGDTLTQDVALGNIGGPTLQITPQGAPSLPGDDLAPLLVRFSDSIGADGIGFTCRLRTPAVWAGTDALTLVIWVRRVTDFSALQPTTALSLFSTDASGSINNSANIDVTNSGGPRWRGSGVFNFGAGFLDSTQVPEASTDRWLIVGVQLTLSPSSVALWVDDQMVGGTTTGSIPSSVTLDQVWLANNWCGAMAHAQIYLGAPASFTHADFLAQRQVGLLGLDRQSTGDRVRSIAAYAGVSAGEVDADRGVAVMSPARLAGKDPLTALLEAETTEQGRLYCRGSSLVFRDRRRRYDI